MPPAEGPAASASAGSRPGGSAPPDLGRRGEELAAAHLGRLGFRILERNHRGPGGEIDLIAFDGAVLAFVEVKSTRGSGTEPLERISRAQRRRLRGLALAWLSDRTRPRPRAERLRFDAVGVHLDRQGRMLRLDHLEDAW